MVRLSALLAAVATSLLVSAGVAIGAARAAAGPPSLCSATDEVVFSCDRGGRRISLCASRAPSDHGRTQLEYLYGTRAKIELEISEAAHPGAFSSGVSALSGGGIDFVRVQDGDFAYVVYSGETPGWSQDGWIVEAHGAAISHHVCRRAATGPQVWGPVYAAKLPQAPDAATFSPPDWVGSKPPR